MVSHHGRVSLGVGYPREWDIRGCRVSHGEGSRVFHGVGLVRLVRVGYTHQPQKGHGTRDTLLLWKGHGTRDTLPPGKDMGPEISYSSGKDTGPEIPYPLERTWDQ